MRQMLGLSLLLNGLFLAGSPCCAHAQDVVLQADATKDVILSVSGMT